ncbi:MAG: hypothetical protein ACRERV_00775 [Methylococcales bacterium]
MVRRAHPTRLVARIHALIRRRAERSDPLIEYGNLRLDPMNHEVWQHGQSVDLSAREFALLHALLLKPGAVL